MAKLIEGGGEEPVFEITPEQLAFIQELKGEKITLAPGMASAGLKEATILSSLTGAWAEFKDRILNPIDPNGFEVARPICSSQFVNFSVELIVSGTTITGLPFIGGAGPKLTLFMSFSYPTIANIGFPNVPASVFLQTPNATWDGVKWVFPPGSNITYSTNAFAEPTYKNLAFPVPYCFGTIDVSYPFGGVNPPYSINNVRLKINWPFWDPPGSPDITFSCTTVPYPQPPDELATFQWFGAKYIYGTPGKPDCFGQFNSFTFTNKYP